MTIFFLISLFIVSAWSQTPEAPITQQNIIHAPNLQLTKSDLVVSEHIVNMFKLIEKGYINQDVLKKLQAEIANSKNFKPFEPWLNQIKQISTLKETKDLIATCGQYTTRKETLPLERVLERMAGNYCRERTLEGGILIKQI